MIKFGNNNIGKLYLGSNPIGKAYLGSNLVYQGGEPPTPPTPTILPIFYDNLNFDGVAYIQTDLLLPQDGSVCVLLGYGSNSLKVEQRIFDVGGLIGAIHDSRSTSTTKYESYFYGGTTAFQLSARYNWASDIELFLTPKRGGWGNFNVGITKGDDFPTTPIIIGQSASLNEQAFSGIIKTNFRVYDSSAQDAVNSESLLNFTPVYTLRPCTYEGEPGLWCVEKKKFYGNSNSIGSLTVSNNE